MADYVLNIGLNLMGFSPFRIENSCEESNLERFTASYGVSPSTCNTIYNDIVEWCREEEMKHPRRIDMFLMYMCWLKTHSTIRNLAGIFSVVEKTIVKWMKQYTVYFKALKAKKVRFNCF